MKYYRKLAWTLSEFAVKSLFVRINVALELDAHLRGFDYQMVILILDLIHRYFAAALIDTFHISYTLSLIRL